MTNDGTQPPSIAPKRPVNAPGASGRPVTGPLSGGTPPSAAVRPPGSPASSWAPATSTSTQAPSPRPKDDADAPSFSDRLKQSAAGVVEAAKGALPTKDDTPASKPDQARKPAPTTRTTTTSAAPAPSGPRRVRLAVARIDPWSVMKLSFLLSVAIGIMIVVAAAVVWYTLDGLHVFTSVNDVIATLAQSTEFFDILEFASFERTLSLATMIAVVDVVLLTALATIGAFLYNIVAALVGGIHLTLTDD